MIKKSLYPKTPRIGNQQEYIITEKLDGSNIGIFNQGGKLLVTSRNLIYEEKDFDKIKIKGLSGWLNKYKDKINLHDGSGLFGEWLGQGHINYDNFDNRLHMFAKANIDEGYSLTNLYYKRDLFKYPFIEQEIPEFISKVPLVERTIGDKVSIQYLDDLYDVYVDKVQRKVEGFIINDGDTIEKYVRYKDGTMEDHHA